MAKRGKRMDYILELLRGPGTLRFVIQPAIAILLGMRDGRNDAKSGRPPYFRGQLLVKGKRKESLQVGLRAVAMPLTLAVVLDSFLQFYIFGIWRLQWALIVGLCLVGIPYVITREIANRIFSFRGRAVIL